MTCNISWCEVDDCRGEHFAGPGTCVVALPTAQRVEHDEYAPHDKLGVSMSWPQQYGEGIVLSLWNPVNDDSFNFTPSAFFDLATEMLEGFVKVMRDVEMTVGIGDYERFQAVVAEMRSRERSPKEKEPSDA